MREPVSFHSDVTSACKTNLFVGCKYKKGIWSECDVNNEKRRVDSLITSSNAECQTTKTLIKKCHVPDENSMKSSKIPKVSQRFS